MDDYKKALRYSFLLLKYRARSENEIISRLEGKEYSSLSIKKVLAFLKDNALVDDEEFVRLYISSSISKGWGPRRIDFNLRKLGLSEELREQVGKNESEYKKRLSEVIVKKISYYKGKKNQFPKIVRSLINKGYEYQNIISELDKLGVPRFERINHK